MTFRKTISLVLALAVGMSALAMALVPRAEANACAAGCRQQHNQCRIQTKGSSSCDAQLQRCLQGCIRR